MTTIGMKIIILPIMPGTNSSGENAATVVSTAKVTGVEISCAPLMAASRRLGFRCWWRWMFSPMMMASSTTMPSTMMKANVETTLAVTSRLGISMIMPRKEMGIPRLTQNARRSSRNSASITNTSAKPMAPFRSMSDSRSIRTSAWFIQTVSVIPSGMPACARAM